MTYLFGLGNPGIEYAHSRHNVGFMAIDHLVAKQQLPSLNFQKKWQAEVLKSNELMLVKPHTFMNDSGKAARAIVSFYESDLAAALPRIFVVFDDLDLPLGSFKLQFGKGPKVHNGLLSLYQHLGSEQFWHVRVGVDNRQGQRTMPGSAYVLASFSPEERAILDQTLTQANEAVLRQVSLDAKKF